MCVNESRMNRTNDHHGNLIVRELVPTDILDNENGLKSIFNCNAIGKLIKYVLNFS